MRLMPLGLCRPGDVLAETLRSGRGQILMARGTRLGERELALLARHRVQLVPIAWPGLEDVEPRPWLSEAAMAAMAGWAARDPEQLTTRDVGAARQLVEALREGEAFHPRLALELLPLYQGGNAVLVAWANLVGLVGRLAQALAAEHMVDWMLAAMFWVLGHPGLVNGELTEPDPAHSARTLRRLQELEAVPPTTRVSLQQHHARWDGSGTPPLRGEAIYRGALVLGMAESLVLLTHRTDPPPLPPQEALEWVIGGAGSEWPLAEAEALTRIVAPYPRGSVVRCGEQVAVVLENVADWPLRPRIRLLSGPEAGRVLSLTDPDQQTRVLTGLYQGRSWPGAQEA